mgnify:CR=1 FL=1
MVQYSGGPTVTLPATTLSDARKLLTIINLNATITISLANAVGGNKSLGGGKFRILISKGASWVLIVED